MAISQNTVLAAAANTTDASTFTTATAAPTALRLLVLVVMASITSGTIGPITITGGPAVTWSRYYDDSTALGNNRRLTIFVALSGASPGSGVLTFSVGPTMTSAAWYMTEWAGAYMGGTALDALYGIGTNATGAATTLQAAPIGYAAAGDATVAVAELSISAALTTERTKIADVGTSAPTQRLGVQWFLGNDADGPSFSWTGSATVGVASFYLRDAANPPPAPPFTPSAVTTFA